MRKSSTSVASTTRPIAHTARSATVARKSSMPDAWPDDVGVRQRRPVAAQRVDEGAAVVPGAVVAGLEADGGHAAARAVRTGSTDSTPGRSPAVAAHACTSADRRRGHDEHLGAGELRLALAEVLVERALGRADGQQLGAGRGELEPQRRAARARRAAPTRRVMTSHGTRCTTSASRENTPTSPDDSVPRRSSRRAPSVHSAGMSERATARATSTTETPAALTARMNGISKHDEPGQRDRDDERREHDRAAGPVHGRRDGVDDLLAGRVGDGGARGAGRASPRGSGSRRAGRSRCTGRGRAR